MEYVLFAGRIPRHLPGVSEPGLACARTLCHNWHRRLCRREPTLPFLFQPLPSRSSFGLRSSIQAKLQMSKSGTPATVRRVR